MKNSIKIITLLLLIFIVSSCKNEKSLQNYFVESQDKKGFITLDVPTSFLQLKSDNVADEVKETLESIRKINVVALPIKRNEEAYLAEKNTLKNLFKDSKEYKSLMTMKAKGMHVNLYYTGDTDAIKEIIAFGYGKDAGVGVARLLGDDMNPAKIIKMMNNIKVDANNINLEQFSAIFKDK